VVDPQRQFAQDLLEVEPDRFEFFGPQWVAGMDDDGQGEIPADVLGGGAA
jgi:hypothetical protein